MKRKRDVQDQDGDDQDVDESSMHVPGQHPHAPTSSTSTTSAHLDQQSSPLLRLPIKLRDQIYASVFWVSLYYRTPLNPANHTPDLNFLLTNRQIFREASALPERRTTLSLEMPPHYEAARYDDDDDDERLWRAQVDNRVKRAPAGSITVVSIKVPFVFDMPKLARGVCSEVGMDILFEQYVGQVLRKREELPALEEVHMHVVPCGVNFGIIQRTSASPRRLARRRARMRKTLEKGMVHKRLRSDMEKAGIKLSFSVELPRKEYDAAAQRLFNRFKKEAQDDAQSFFENELL